MKEGGYLLLEKENREIIIFDVLKFSLEENPYSNRIIGGDILIKLNSHGYYKLIDIYEFPDSIGIVKSIKFNMLFYSDRTGNTLNLKGCVLSEATFNQDETFEVRLIIDYYESNPSDETTLNMIKSFKRDEKLKSIGII
jgi:hypothetical protein